MKKNRCYERVTKEAETNSLKLYNFLGNNEKILVPNVSNKTTIFHIENTLNNQKCCPTFAPFVQTLKNYILVHDLGYECLNIGAANISGLEIIKDKFETNEEYPLKWNSGYNYAQNKIFDFGDVEAYLSHEFLHAFTRLVNDKISLVGFFRETENYNFFFGLNEGYTELLNKRIFNNYTRTHYDLFLDIIRIIEFMFDDYRDMERSYFTCNPFYIYQNFCKYGTKSEFVYLCEQLDIMAKTRIEEKQVTNLKNMLYDIIKENNIMNYEFEMALDDKHFTKRKVS